MPRSRIPDLDALRMLRAVVQRGSIAGAAHALGRSQQAVSARMRTLESVVGVQLLVRSPQGAAPTDAGTLLVSWADEVLDAADRLEVGIGTLTGSSAARLTVAASQTIAENLLPRWLIRLRDIEETAGISPTITELRVANSTVVAELVRAGDYELGLVETPRLPAGLIADWLGNDELVTVVAPAHPWASLDAPLPLAELAATPLVMRETGSGTRDAFTDILASQNPPLTPQAQVELGTAAAVRSAIAAGIAPGVLSRVAVRDDLVLGRLSTVVIDTSELLRPLTAVHRAPGKLSNSAQRLIRIAQDELAGSTSIRR
jgi:DNA-binding transcriptional LysR family regulator